MYKIPYNIWLGFILKISLVMLVAGVAIVSVAPMIGLL